MFPVKWPKRPAAAPRMAAAALLVVMLILTVAPVRGAETVIVGIQPEVAFAMVQLGLTLEGVATALDLEEGLAYLNQKFKTMK